MALAVQAVDDHAGADQDEKERPIFPEDRPRVEVGQPAPQQQERADGDQEQRADYGATTYTTISRHGTPF